MAHTRAPAALDGGSSGVLPPQTLQTSLESDATRPGHASQEGVGQGAAMTHEGKASGARSLAARQRPRAPPAEPNAPVLDHLGTPWPPSGIGAPRSKALAVHLLIKWAKLQPSCPAAQDLRSRVLSTCALVLWTPSMPCAPIRTAIIGP